MRELPSREAVSAYLHRFVTPRDGYDDVTPRIGDAGKAFELAEELKKS